MGTVGILLVTGILLLGQSYAQREVTVQRGPLYRTVGSHISIWCKVRGYQGPAQQNFLWSIYLPSAPDREVQVVSTEDSAFSYAIYSQRVRSGDIYIERVEGDHVLLHIRQLQERDTGEYECHTPNTDPTYHGSYSAKMNLIGLSCKVVLVLSCEVVLGLSCEVVLGLSCEVVLVLSCKVALVLSCKVVLVLSCKVALVFSCKVALVFSCKVALVLSCKVALVLFCKVVLVLSCKVALGLSCKVALVFSCKVALVFSCKVALVFSCKSFIRTTRDGLRVQRERGGLRVQRERDGLRVQRERDGLRVQRERGGLRVQRERGGLRVQRKRGGLRVQRKRGGLRGKRDGLRVQRERDGLRVQRKRDGLRVQRKRDGLRVQRERDGLRVQRKRGGLRVQGERGGLRVQRARGGLRVQGERDGLRVQRKRDGLRLQGKRDGLRVQRERDGLRVQRKRDGLRVQRERDGLRVQRKRGGLRVQGERGGLRVQRERGRLRVQRERGGLRVQRERGGLRVQGKRGGLRVQRARGGLRGKRDGLRVQGKRDGLRVQGERDGLRVQRKRDGLRVQGERDGLRVQRERDGLRVQRERDGLRVQRERDGLRVQRERDGLRVQRERDGLRVQTAGGKSSLIRALLSSETGFAVTAISRTPGVSYYDSFDLQCILKPHYPPWVGVSVTWRFQPTGGGETHDLVTFTRAGGVQWGERAGNFRGRSIVEKSDTSHNVRLSISRASESEAGKYQCVAELWRREYNASWARLAERASNLLEIRVQRPVSRLQVSKVKRSLSVVEGSQVSLSCSVRSQTSPDSRFSVLWFAHRSPGADGKLIVRSAASTEYGTYAEEAGLKGRLQMEAPVSGQYTLTLQGVRLEDSGSYYCHVEEWVMDPNQAWYRLAEEASGMTEVRVRMPDINLQLDQLPRNLSVLEGESFTVTCQVLNRTLAESRLSIQWLSWQVGDTERRTLARLTADAVTVPAVEEDERGNLAQELPTRLQLSQPSPGLYTLTLHRAEEQDSGAYSCLVQEWLQDPGRKWYKRVEDRSAVTYVSVRRPDPALQLEATPLNVSVIEDGHFELDCIVSSRSRLDSQLAVSWSLHSMSRGAELETLLSTDRSGVWAPLNPRWEGRLQQFQLSPTLFRLRVPEVRTGDSGNYTCSVQEWLPGPRGDWYLLAQDEAHIGMVRVKSKDSTLQSVICSNDALFYLVFFYPFPIFGILIITILLVRFRHRPSSKTGEGKNGVPLLWIKEPHLNYSPTCLEPPVLSIHPGTID
ncbi:immunoglobulin superfamily member 3-like [Rhinophrynus dorsalis]